MTSDGNWQPSPADKGRGQLSPKSVDAILAYLVAIFVASLCVFVSALTHSLVNDPVALSVDRFFQSLAVSVFVAVIYFPCAFVLASLPAYATYFVRRRFGVDGIAYFSTCGVLAVAVAMFLFLPPPGAEEPMRPFSERFLNAAWLMGPSSLIGTIVFGLILRLQDPMHEHGINGRKEEFPERHSG